MEKTKIETLTPEQEKLMIRVRDEWIGHALGGDCSVNTAELQAGVNWLYGLCKLEKPRLLVVDSPMAAVTAAHLLGRTEVKNTDFYGWWYDLWWTSSWDFYARIGLPGVVDHDGLRRWIRYLRLGGVWDTVLLERAAIISRRPVLVKRDERNRLHAERGPACLFRDGFATYAWHGTRLSGVTPLAERLILDPGTLTAEEILAERNSEVVRAIGERMGWDQFLKRLKTKVVDEWKDAVTGLRYELHDFEERKGELPRLLRMESPKLNDETQPWYVEPVDPGLATAMAARKWQVPHPPGHAGSDPGAVVWPTVPECNEDPNIRFEIER